VSRPGLVRNEKMTSDWTLALEQRSDLSVAHGSAAGAAAAVRCGADLRLYMTTPTYEETLYFQQTYAGNGEAFAGLMTHHHSYEHRGAPADQPYISLFKYDTSGTFSQVKWMLGNQVFDESQTYPYGVYRWFVCNRWRLVYEHDEMGRSTFGNLAELKETVRTGRSIRVGIKHLFGLARNDTSGPAHVSFLTTMQPLIEHGQVLSNCDVAVIGPAKWPFTWQEGLHLAMLRPSTSGEVVCYLTEPGRLPFERIVPRRAMAWLVADMC
jgi:hypothetical protein